MITAESYADKKKIVFREFVGHQISVAELIEKVELIAQENGVDVADPILFVDSGYVEFYRYWTEKEIQDDIAERNAAHQAEKNRKTWER